jgi:predicted RNase H-like HicB family nuclease
VVILNTKIKIVYWKGKKFWLGKILEHPEIMSQGETVEELEENLKDAYKLMLMEDVPSDYQLKEISV